jgi:hypothetical protein
MTDITETARELRERAVEMQNRLVEGIYYEDYDQASADLRAIPALLDHLAASERQVEVMRAALSWLADDDRMQGKCQTCGVWCEGCVVCACSRPTWTELSSADIARTALATLDAAGATNSEGHGT